MSNLLEPRCPRCHKGKLFTSLLKVTPCCPACGLIFEGHDAGDGPVYFTVLFLGILITVAASIVEYKFSPPLWMHAALWLPMTVVVSVWSLRFFKAMLISLEYHQGRLKG